MNADDARATSETHLPGHQRHQQKLELQLENEFNRIIAEIKTKTVTGSTHINTKISSITTIHRLRNLGYKCTLNIFPFDRWSYGQMLAHPGSIQIDCTVGWGPQVPGF